MMGILEQYRTYLNGVVGIVELCRTVSGISKRRGENTRTVSVIWNGEVGMLEHCWYF